VIRGAFFIVGLCAVAWGSSVFISEWNGAVLDRVSRHIIAGDKFKYSILTELAPSLDAVRRNSVARPSALYNVAVIQLRTLEEAISVDDQATIDARFEQLQKDLIQSLGGAPADPFLWWMLFWARNATLGFERENLSLLQMSYRTGPNEGWVALRRNRSAMVVYSELPPDLFEAMQQEFVRLVASRSFFRVAAWILGGPGWPIRETLLARLAGLPESDRQIFARVMYEEGYNVLVPGVPPRGSRPWR
jgi:hypothetical protein